MSSAGSEIEYNEEEAVPTSPGPPPPLSRSQYAAYSAILHDLDLDHQYDLAKTLINESGRELDESADGEEDDELLNEAASSTTPSSGPRRVDGPTFAPTYQDAAVSSLRRRRRTHESKERSSTRWPLSIAEMPAAPATLDEALMAFTASYIRSHRLALRGSATKPEDIDEFPVVPDDFIASLKNSIETVLVCLANTRPVEVKQKRKSMAPMDWNSVLAAASLGSISQNSRLRAIYRPLEADILLHRLNVMNQTQRPMNTGESFYASLIPKQDRLVRLHQSKTEIADRDERRRDRETKQKTKDTSKALKKRRRRTWR